MIKVPGSRAQADEGGPRRDYAQEIVLLEGRIGTLNGQVEALRHASKDAEDLQQRVQQLRAANQHLVLATFGAQDLQASAEASNRHQTEFLSMLAHELRNPLAPIAMANDLLGKVAHVHPQLPKLNAIIARQVKHMVRLVDDLLDASRMSSGKITLRMAPVLLSDVMAAAFETCRAQVDARQQPLLLDLPEAPVVLHGDLIRLSQVFANLLINASKFSPENETISVSARVDGKYAVVAVRDSGVGIAADLLPRIFELFTQGFRSLERSQGGLGIGLSLVRGVVEMHGGTVRAASEGVGLGSQFTVTLPLSASAPAPGSALAPVPVAVPVRARRILLIEDNADANETLKLLLEAEGCRVTVAFDGPSGLAMAQQDCYDIVICDIGLPGLDGYQVVSQLHRTADTPAPLCIAVSGYNTPDDRARARRAGFDLYLVKPIEMARLLACFDGAGRRR